MLNKERTTRMTRIVALVVAASFIIYFIPMLSGAFSTPTRSSGNGSTSPSSTINTKPATEEDKLQNLLGQAELNFKSKNYSQAVNYYQQAFSIDPNNLTAQAGLGSSQVLAGQIEAGYNQLLQVTKNNPDQAESQFYLGEAAAKLGKNDEAKVAYNAYLKASPTGDHATDAKSALEKLEN